MYVYKWSQDLMYKNNVSKKKEKKRYTLSSLHHSKHINTLPNKMVHTNSPPKKDYSHIKTTPPFCHE